MSEEVTPSVQIRKAVPADSRRIAAVLLAAFTEYKSLYTAEAFAATTPTSEQILVRLSEGPIWVALLNQTIVGTVAAVPKPAALYLRGMAIVPAARGARIGHKLLVRAEEFARQHGCESLLLSTTPFLTSAIRLYEQHGFSRSDEGPHDLLGTPLFTMTKILPPVPIPEFGCGVAGVEYVLRPGSYAVIFNAAGEVAVVSAPLGVFLPGGGQAESESAAEAASRETREECGLHILIRQSIGLADQLVFAASELVYYRKRCAFFLAEVVAETCATESDHQLVWLAPAEALRQLQPESQRWALAEALRLKSVNSSAER